MVRTVHSRFLRGQSVPKSSPFDKIITVVWSYKGSKLRYGATVYHKSKQSWNKKKHRERALERYDENPIKVELTSETGMPKLRYIAIDNFISTELIYKFGAYRKKDIMYQEKYPINKYFNNYYYPNYDLNEWIEKNSQYDEDEDKELRETCSSFCFRVMFPLIFIIPIATVLFSC
jgi:hypothetical protein